MDVDQFLNETHSTIDQIRTPDEISTDIVVLNQTERDLVNRVFENLRVYSPETMVGVATRIMDLERLSVSISRYPSMHERGILAGRERSTETLIDTLCCFGDGERLLTLPTKAILGKGFLVAKFHAFAAITKVAVNSFFAEEEIRQLRQATLNIMFTLMAEDVYMSLLDDRTSTTRSGATSPSRSPSSGSTGSTTTSRASPRSSTRCGRCATRSPRTSAP
jgi:hypothetical protein